MRGLVMLAAAVAIGCSAPTDAIPDPSCEGVAPGEFAVCPDGFFPACDFGDPMGAPNPWDAVVVCDDDGAASCPYYPERLPGPAYCHVDD